jgi:hypothetical protein
MIRPGLALLYGAKPYCGWVAYKHGGDRKAGRQWLAQDTSPGLVTSTPSTLYIGVGNRRSKGTFWKGLIDDVGIYNRVVKP